tara:strand:- start:662 stop:847 length:186 start_codon:yes stop_codon:yes gene_type:complete
MDLKLDLDVGTIIAAIAGISVLGGFYYTTQYRLDNIESMIEEIKVDIAKTKKLIRKKEKSK